MADEFGQFIQGLHEEGDSTVATDSHPAVFGKDNSGNYAYLNIDSTSGGLKVDIVDATGITVDVDIAQFNVDDIAGATDKGTVALVVRDDALTTLTPIDGDYVRLRVNSLGALWTALIDSNGDELNINSDGSLNVSITGASDTAYVHNSATLVKDTTADVVSEAPIASTDYVAIMVSGAGLCEWEVLFGTTGTENAILKFWTTPSHPTHFVDLPDSLNVVSGETLKVTGTNRERAASPASDFDGFASLIKKQ